jgi:hypothetical protein
MTSGTSPLVARPNASVAWLFTTGFPRFLSIRGARGLLALNQVLI